MIDMNLHNFDYYLKGLSGGKDSTAAFLWLVYESGLPVSKIRAVCCDTGNEDPITYAYLAMLTELTGVPINYLVPQFKGEDTDFYKLALSKGAFPARRSQFCTEFLKVRVLTNHTFDLCKKGRVLHISSIRKAEGKADNNRGNLNIFGEGAIINEWKYRPIYNWDLDKIKAIHNKYIPMDVIKTLLIEYGNLGQYFDEVWQRIDSPMNPLYSMGCSRVGCFPCINAKKGEFLALSRYRPEKADEIHETEKAIGKSFVHRNTTPKRFWSMETKNKKGGVYMAPSIYDTMTWANTLRGAKLPMFEFAKVHEIEHGSLCSMAGLCE